MIGQKFGRLTVANSAPSKNWRKQWVCTCDCGSKIVADGPRLRSGKKQSCGCLRVEATTRMGKSNKSHGQAVLRSAEYNAWGGMIARCHNDKSKQYNNYGARGITVCDEWRDDFEAFLRHIGPRPSSKHSIDRIDNNAGYAPGNVRWSDQHTQNNNQRRNIRVVLGGVDATVSEHISRFGLNRGTIWSRIYRGWDIERTFSEPIRDYGT